MGILTDRFGGRAIFSMALLYFRWVRDSQSGMWVFRRAMLKQMRLELDGMAFPEEIKIEALKNSRVRFGEISIVYSSRPGEIKLNPWKHEFQQSLFPLSEALLAAHRRMKKPGSVGPPRCRL